MDVNVKICSFCSSSSDDEVLYGKFYELSGIQTHYYCLLLSSNMQQHGKDDEGILGFLIKDIHKEISRGKRLKCSYCREKGATLGCCESKCKKVFHLPCGRRNNSLHHFYGEYKSYCMDHRPVQVISTPVLEDSLKSVNNCAICFETMEPWPNINTLWAPCCSVNSWFHRNCIQKLSLSAGYFFKCPLCNNKDYFQMSMLEQGIYIPEQDASWELVPNAFAELLERYEQCDADTCLSPRGRKHISHRTRWDIVLCRLCGSQGIHVGCGKLKSKRSVWECSNCTSMLQSVKKSHSISVDQPGVISNNISEPEEVNNSNGMRRSQQLSSNADLLETGSSRSQRSCSSRKSDTESHGAPRSTQKDIKSGIENETVSSGDEIQATSAVLGNSSAYITRSRVREARYTKIWAEKVLLYGKKFKLKEVRIVLSRCDEASLKSKEGGNKVSMEDGKKNELATIPFCGLTPNINRGFLVQFHCKGFFGMEDYILKNQYYSIGSDFTTNNLKPATSKLERSRSVERVHTESLSTVITDSSGENVDMEMYSKCLQIEKSISNYDSWTNNSLHETIKSSTFICTSNKEDFYSRKMLETNIIPDSKLTTFSVSGNVEHNPSKAPVSAPKQTHGNKNSEILNIVGNICNKSYNVSKIIYNVPSISDSRKLDIEWYGKMGNDWNKTCTPQSLFGLDSSYKSFNFSFYRQLDVNLNLNSSMKRKLMHEIPRQVELPHELYSCNNCAIETSTCVVCKIKTLKRLNNTSKFLQYQNQKDISDHNLGINLVDKSDFYSEKKIKKFKVNHHFSDFSYGYHEEAKFNVSENSYDLKYFQHGKIDSHNSDMVNPGETLMELDKNIVSSDAINDDKRLNEDLCLYEPLTFNEIYASSNSINPSKDFVTNSVKQQLVDNVTSLGTKISEYDSDKNDMTLKKLFIKQTFLQEKLKQKSVRSDENSMQTDFYPVPQVFKTLKLECDYLFNRSDVPYVFCASEKYGISKDKNIPTSIRYPEDYKNQILSLNEVGTSFHNYSQPYVKQCSYSYTGNCSDFFNTLRDEHNVTQIGEDVKCLFNLPDKNRCNKNLYQNNQNPLNACFALESSNIQDQKQTSRKTLCNSLNISRQTEHCKSKRNYRREALNRESDDNTLMLGKSRHHFKRNHTDLKQSMKGVGASEKNNVFNVKNHYPGNFCIENNTANPVLTSTYSDSDLSGGSSHSLKKLAVNELKRLGAISHRPSRITVKQINSENVMINFFDSHTEKIYRGLGIVHSVLK